MDAILKFVGFILLMPDVLCRPGGLKRHKAHGILHVNLAREEEARELWLDDFTKDYLYDMQGDSPTGGSTCPPPPEHIEAWACKATSCASDVDCTGAHTRCCNNGCRFTCMATVQEPPVVDWIREPPRILKSGYSWLVPGEESDNQGSNSVEWCSTSALDEDEDALLCPHGYQCHIEAPGDPAAGVPNRGRCLKQRAHTQEPRQTFRLKPSAIRSGVCVFEDQEIPDQAEFVYHHYPCSCIDGSIECVVRSDNDT